MIFNINPILQTSLNIGVNYITDWLRSILQPEVVFTLL
jgi:hypothetical protein